MSVHISKFTPGGERTVRRALDKDPTAKHTNSTAFYISATFYISQRICGRANSAPALWMHSKSKVVLVCGAVGGGAGRQVRVSAV